MGEYGSFVHHDRQERLDAKRAGARRAADRAAERVAAREWVTQQGLLNEMGQPCPWAIQAALRLRGERGAGMVPRSLVVAAVSEQKRRAWTWVGDGAKEQAA